MLPKCFLSSSFKGFLAFCYLVIILNIGDLCIFNCQMSLTILLKSRQLTHMLENLKREFLRLTPASNITSNGQLSDRSSDRTTYSTLRYVRIVSVTPRFPPGKDSYQEWSQRSSTGLTNHHKPSYCVLSLLTHYLRNFPGAYPS